MVDPANLVLRELLDLWDNLDSKDPQDCLEMLDPQVDLETRVLLDVMVKTVLMVILVLRVQLVTVVNLEKMVFLDFLDLWEKRVHLVVQVLQDCLDTKDLQESKETRVSQDPKDPEDDLVLQDLWVLLANLDPGEPEVKLERLEKWVKQVDQVLLVQEVEMDLKDPWANLEKLEIWVYLVWLVNPVPLVPPDPLDLQAKANKWQPLTLVETACLDHLVQVVPWGLLDPQENVELQVEEVQKEHQVCLAYLVVLVDLEDQDLLGKLVPLENLAKTVDL